MCDRDEVQIQVRVPVALRDEFQAAARAADLSMAQAARRALAAWLTAETGETT